MEKTELSGSGTWIEFITSWFTPTVLFCALNMMIGAIFVSSNLKSRTKQQDINDHEHRNYNPYPFQLIRPPSLLKRVRSLDFSLFPAPHETQQLEPSLLQRVKSIRLSCIFTSSSPSAADQTRLAQPEENHTVAADDHAGRESVKMKKSESMKPIAAKVTDDEGDQIRPPTTREGNKTACLGVDDEVDAKADDFINRFRQHLKLQRLESLLRYKELLKRGSSSKSLDATL